MRRFLEGNIGPRLIVAEDWIALALQSAEAGDAARAAVRIRDAQHRIVAAKRAVYDALTATKARQPHSRLDRLSAGLRVAFGTLEWEEDEA